MVDTKNLELHLRRDMEALRDRLRGMAELVFQQLEDAIASFSGNSRKLAYMVVLRDRRVDQLEDHIDRLGQEFLIRHMPVAKQLRFVVAVAKVNSELERLGDYAEAIARRVVTLYDLAEVPQRAEIVEMSRHAFQMLRDAVTAFLDDDAELALHTLELDNTVDEMNAAIFTALARAPVERADLTARFALLGLLNRIERVADRACNIAEEAVYVVRGDVLRHLPREDKRVLFLCDHNSCRSQVAEAIARSLAPANLLFASAGANPQPVDPRAVAALARHGLDASHQRSKSLSEVGPIEDFDVVVTLSQVAEEACPPVPYDAVALNWEIRDPGKAAGSEAEVAAVYDQIYEDLRDKVAELVEVLAGNQEEQGEGK
jgi:phosphate transport system protein